MLVRIGFGGPLSRNAGNTVRRPEFAILRVLVGLAANFKSHYCFPTQAKICELLWKFKHIRMSRRTLCRTTAMSVFLLRPSNADRDK